MSGLVTNYDIIIIGGGLVGASAALALSGHGLNIALVDSQLPDFAKLQNQDARSIALNDASKQIFTALSIWDELKVQAQGIDEIHVSDKGRMGFTRFKAFDYGLSHLGYVVGIADLLSCLYSHLEKAQDICCLAPMNVTKVSPQASSWILETQDNQRLSCNLLLAADGTLSPIRKQLNIPIKQDIYPNTAIVCNISTKEITKPTAYERFTSAGPLALLPTKNNQYVLIWTVDKDKTENYINLSDQDFLQKVQEYFGYRLGRFTKVTKRLTHPLGRIFAEEQIKPGFVLLGNAAHTLHPIAAQGFNLCLRDIAQLAETIINAKLDNKDYASLSCLQEYLNLRLPEQQRLWKQTHQLLRYFSFDIMPIRAARNLGMILLDNIPILKNKFAEHALGYSGKVSQLARGVRFNKINEGEHE